MKKVILMLALMFSVSAVFVSCKDSEKEKYFYESEGYNYQTELKDEFQLFHYRKNKGQKSTGYLYLQNDIVRAIRRFLPTKVRDYFIHPTENPEYTYRFDGEKDVLKKYSLLYSFYSAGSIKLSTSLKLLKESKRSMQKYCNIKEFYKDSKDLDFLHTETMALLFFILKEEYLQEENFQLDKFAFMMRKFISGDLIREEGYVYTTRYLNYLKGVKNIRNKNENINHRVPHQNPCILFEFSPI